MAYNEWSPVHPTSIHWIIRLGEEMLEFYYKLQPKQKQLQSLQFTDALLLIWSVLPEKNH